MNHAAEIADAEWMLRLLRRDGKKSLKRDYFWCGWNEGHRAGVQTAALVKEAEKAEKKGKK